MIDISKVPRTTLEMKETLGMIENVDGDMVYVNMDIRRDFLTDLAEALVDVLSLGEFRKIDDAYLQYLQALETLETFEDVEYDESEASEVKANALDLALSQASYNFKCVVAGVLNREAPPEDGVTGNNSSNKN